MEVGTARVAEVLVELADGLVDDYDLIEFLQRVTTRTEEITQADAVGLLLADQRNTLHFMAASDETTRLLELFQVQQAEGPCLDAFRTAVPVVNTDLRRATERWPLFAPEAVRSGFGSVHAIPMRLRSTVIGALNMFSAQPGRLTPEDVKVVQALADVATIAILQERALRRSEMLAEQLQAALDSRIVIEQAKGALARIHGVGVDQAFVLLRTYCRNHNRKLSDIAQAVVTEPAGVPGLTRT